MDNRQKYLEAIRAQLEPNIFKHSLAVETCMGALYDYFQSQNLLDPNEPKRNEWTLAGLIHRSLNQLTLQKQKKHYLNIT